MGDWTLTIEGHGLHHNGRGDDAEQLAADFVAQISMVGQKVRSASLVTNGEATDVVSVLENRPELAPVPAGGDPAGEPDQAGSGAPRGVGGE